MDIEIQAKEIMYHKANLNRIMAECTGQPIEKVCACMHSAQNLIMCTMDSYTLACHSRDAQLVMLDSRPASHV